MDITNMSSEERTQEQTHLAEAISAAIEAARETKAAVTKAKAEVKAAKNDEEKAAAQKVLKEAETSAKAASAKVAEAKEREAAFLKAIEEITKSADPFEALARKYAKNYPDCKTFYITSDMQVFLEGDENIRLAKMHQRSLEDGEVRTINVQ